MNQPISIPCELTITPGAGTASARICLTASGETVFCEYEHELDEGQKMLVAAMCEAHSRLLGKYGQKLTAR